MKEIICHSKKHGNKIALVNNKDFKNLNEYNWFYNTSNYAYAIINNKKILMHQFIIGKVKNLIIDHKNNNRLDNRRENIRHVTRQQNNQNKKSKNKYQGVCWSEKAKKYRMKKKLQEVMISLLFALLEKNQD
jgi:hypothetical protein